MSWNSVEEAINELNDLQEGFPFELIEYLRKQEGTGLLRHNIKKNLTELSFLSYHPIRQPNYYQRIWWAIIAEAHIDDWLVDLMHEVIMSVGHAAEISILAPPEKDPNEDLYHNELDFLVGRICQEKGKPAVTKLLQEMALIARLEMDRPYLLLGEALFFADNSHIGLALEAMEYVAKYDLSEVRESSAKTRFSGLLNRLSFLVGDTKVGKGEATDWVKLVSDLRHLLKDLGGEDLTPEPYCKTRGNWKEYYADLVDRFPAIIEKKTPIVVAEKVGRNDPCTCGSGKKYKKCCLKEIS